MFFLKDPIYCTLDTRVFFFFFHHSDFSSTLETVRQMLGLEEEQVVEISGDHSKYEVPDVLK